MEGTADSEPSDASLIDAIRHSGSESAFRTLYDRHTLAAYRAAWRILGSAHDAEDATQEAWLRAFNTLERWRGETAFGAWLRGIAVHVAIDQVRKTVRFAGEVDHEANVSNEFADDRLDISDAIRALPPGYRAVLVLHDVEGFTHEEIGQRLGITAGTSKGQLFKARRAVRARLGVATTRNG